MPDQSMRAALQQVAAEAEAIVKLAEEDCAHQYAWMPQASIHTLADRIRVTALAQINALNEAAGIRVCDEAATEAGANEGEWHLLIPDPAVLLAESPRPDKGDA